MAALGLVLAIFEYSLAVLGKISTLWGLVHRMLTLKGAPHFSWQKKIKR